MLKLILHHTYKLGGQAVDLSRHGNHGFVDDVEFHEEGREPGSGALEFGADTSRVHVQYKPVWDKLSALRIEAWVKLAALGHRHTLAVGQNAFSFVIRPDGVLEGSFVPPAAPGGPPPPSLRVNSETASPDHITRTVPVAAWTRLTYFHDGVNALRLYIDDTLVACAYQVRHPVSSVAPDGVWIGHGLAGHDRTLRGELDELKIWKYDPQSPAKQFFGRPTDERQRDCLRDFMAHLGAVLSDPQKKQQLDSWLHCTQGVLADVVRDVRARGEESIRQQEEYSRQYLALWTQGDLSGPKMRAWMGAWFDWLRSTLGPPVVDGYVDRLRTCYLQHPGLDPLELAGDIANCDRELAAYLRTMGEVLHERDPSLGWAPGTLDGKRIPLRPERQEGPGQFDDGDRRGQGPSPCGC